jgi:UPF0716 protein FxsA
MTQTPGRGPALMRLLFLLFIIVPIAELMLLIKVGQTIGALPTIVLVLATAAIGVRILRHQSLSTLKRAQQRMQGGELPGREIVEGFLISIGGALMLTPGFITDLFAIFLLLPFTRKALVGYLFQKGRLKAMGTGPGAFVFTRFGGGWPPHGGPGGRDIYEGEYSRDDEPKTPLRGPKGPSEL